MSSCIFLMGDQFPFCKFCIGKDDKRGGTVQYIQPDNIFIQNLVVSLPYVTYCLQQTTLALDSDKTRAQGSFGPLTGGQNLTVRMQNT